MDRDYVLRLILSTVSLEEEELTWVEKDHRYKQRKAHYLNGRRINRDEYRAIRKLLHEYNQTGVQQLGINWEQFMLESKKEAK